MTVSKFFIPSTKSISPYQRLAEQLLELGGIRMDTCTAVTLHFEPQHHQVKRVEFHQVVRIDNE